MEGSDNERPEDAVVSRGTMEIVVSLALMAVASLVMLTSYRLGAGWAPDVGPDSGYFPFYVALIMFITSGVTLVMNVVARSRASSKVFIGRTSLIRVLQLLVPMTIFVVLSIYIGIYISTFLFLGFFMVWHGSYPMRKALPIAILVPILLFIIFEIWFLVPLPKGPLEAWLGY